MDISEYTIINQKYNSIELQKIDKFNKEHLNIAIDLLKFNRDQLLYDNKYKNLSDLDRLKFIQDHEQYKVFCRLYPIVSKYIIILGLFNSKAFIKYLDWKAKIRPTESFRSKLLNNPREQRLWYNKYWYSVYVKFLFQEKNKHCKMDDVNKIYNETLEQLNKETNDFFDLYEKELKKSEETEKKYTEEKKEEIKKQLKIKMEKELDKNLTEL